MKKRILLITLLGITLGINAQEYIESKTWISGNDANNAIGEKNAIWRNNIKAPTIQNNFPNQQNWWSIFQTQFHDTRYDAQLAFGLNKQDLWLRYNYNGNWKQWKKIVLTDFNGNVGIGTDIPDAKLSVNGKIHAKEVKVDLTGWPDYVFKKEYKLPTLTEVEKHIKKEGHLKDIPSEKEALKNGIHLGKMNAKLLQKIEELTLYTIQQQKAIEEEKKKNNAFEKRISRLETLITSKIE
jgi:hypothetical protein